MNFVPSFIKKAASRIRSFDDLAAITDRHAPVVTMFSGGLDSTYLLYKLKKLGFTHIDAVAVNVGEPINKDQLTQITARFGARFIYVDGRQNFVEHGLKPAIRANARYLGNYPLSSSLSRPIIAAKVIDHAQSIDSKLVLHTANLSQNSLPRLNNSIEKSGFYGCYGSPYERSITSRQEKATTLSKLGLTFMADRKLSGDENLWCREFESGPLDDPEQFTIPEDAFSWTRIGDDLSPETVELGFKDGNLVCIDGDNIALIDALATLNTKIGKFGHGRYVGLEHLSTGEKVLEVREAPAAAIILDALRHLETASLPTNSILLKQTLEQTWVNEAVSGEWGSTVHIMCDRAIASALEGVSGRVTYMLDQHRFLPQSIIADAPRYIRDRDFWEYQVANAKTTLQNFAFG